LGFYAKGKEENHFAKVKVENCPTENFKISKK
jgi:hypothetical protein